MTRRARRLVELSCGVRAEDRRRMDEPRDRDGVLAGPVRAQARGGHLGRRADPAVEHDVDVWSRQDRVDVRGDVRPDPDIETARLAEVQPLLLWRVDDAATELEPRACEAGFDDDLPRTPGRPDGGSDLVHPATVPDRPRGNEVVTRGWDARRMQTRSAT